MFGKNGPTFWELTQQALSSTARGYDLLAPKFDVTPFRTPDAVLERALSGLGAVDDVLDLCCGTGAAMERLRPICRRRLAGIDFSHGMLAQAWENLAKVPGPATIELIEGDVLEMAFQQEFDLITCFGALGHILPRDERAFLQRIHAALRPGGRFVFVTAPHPSPLSRASLFSHAFNGVMRVRNALVRPPFIMYYLTFLLPGIARHLEELSFEVEIDRGLFPAPFQRYCRVSAMRSDVSPPPGGAA